MSPDHRRKPYHFVSLILPCYNERESVALCCRSAKAGLKELQKAGYTTELIVVDNNSSDGSKTLAKKTGARVLTQKKQGYGAALQKGFAAAYGDILIMADADSSYPLSKLLPFVRYIEKGYDIVLGSRFLGRINKKSMPFFNRVIGNPMLTGLLNIFYGTHVSDSQTGMRAITKSAYMLLRLTSPGMEFASDMLIKAIHHRMRIAEIPIAYYPRIGTSKLSPVSDAWRHVREMIIWFPFSLYLIPGVVLVLLGLGGTAVLVSGPKYIGNGVVVDTHTMVAGIIAAILGTQLILGGIFSRLYMVRTLGISGEPLTAWVIRIVSFERLFCFGAFLLVVSFLILSSITVGWIAGGFSALGKEREFIGALGLAAIGGQLTMSSFLVGMMKKDLPNQTIPKP